jgi:hypothetical protein
MQMKKSITEFAVETDKSGVIKRIGKSVVLQPRTHFCRERTKWFDDSKLLKKKK